MRIIRRALEDCPHFFLPLSPLKSIQSELKWKQASNLQFIPNPHKPCLNHLYDQIREFLCRGGSINRALKVHILAACRHSFNIGIEAYGNSASSVCYLLASLFSLPFSVNCSGKFVGTGMGLTKLISCSGHKACIGWEEFLISAEPGWIQICDVYVQSSSSSVRPDVTCLRVRLIFLEISLLIQDLTFLELTQAKSLIM